MIRGRINLLSIIRLTLLLQLLCMRVVLKQLFAVRVKFIRIQIQKDFVLSWALHVLEKLFDFGKFWYLSLGTSEEINFFLRISLLRKFGRLIKLVKGEITLLFDKDFNSILATISHVFQSYDTTNFPVPSVVTCSATADNSWSGGAIRGHGGEGAEVSVRWNTFI